MNNEEYLKRQHHLRERLYGFINQLVAEENVTPNELTDAVCNVAQGVVLMNKVAVATVMAEEKNANN